MDRDSPSRPSGVDPSASGQRVGRLPCVQHARRSPQPVPDPPVQYAERSALHTTWADLQRESDGNQSAALHYTGQTTRIRYANGSRAGMTLEDGARSDKHL